ncbi:MAG: ABC transporter permease [Anaerolineaceae bacterium]
MKKTFLVFRNEFITTVTRKSFLITLFLLPLLSFVITLIIGGIQSSTGASAGSIISDLMVPSVKNTLEGFVDESGLVTQIPEGYQFRLSRFNSESEASQALSSKEISAYYLIDKNYLQNGKIIYVRPDFNPLGGSIQSSSIDALMAYNLTGGDLNLYYRVQNPVNAVTETIGTTAPERDQNNPLTFFLPYIVTFLFYIVIITSASLLLNSITSEKQNYMMELLMTSITPRQMLNGKITALGIAGLLQTVVWSGSGLLLLRYSGQNLALADAFQLPTSILIWGILFFILGYAVYASLMAGIGALVPNMREASQLTIVVVIPLIVPLMFISTLIQSPDSMLSIVLSMFPLTAPVAMMTRLAATNVPLWQIGVTLLLLALTALFMIRAAAGLFRAQNLLSGKSISAKNFIRALAGKA